MSEKEIRRRVLMCEYKKNLKNYIVTSRFNNSTWKENKEYRESNKRIGCIYCSPVTITSEIPQDMILFVLEMNNDNNKILGIGLVRNHPIMNKYNVYKNGNYNRYTYVGKTRIDRNEMTNEEEIVIKALEILCFKGSQNLKRGHGINLFPINLLYNCLKKIDIVDFINKMFKGRIE